MRRNTVGVRYIEGNRNEDHYEKIIEEFLGISEDELYGLDDEIPGGKQIMIKVTNAAKYNFICDYLLDKHFTVAPGHVVQVEDLSSYLTRVMLDFVPFELTNESLCKLLENYGEVGRVDFIRKKYRNDSNSKYSKAILRRRVAYIRLNKTIPSSLYLNQTNTYIYVRHERQTITCHRCGQADHKILNCKMRFDQWINKVDIDISDIDEESDSDSEDDNSVYEDSINEISVNMNGQTDSISSQAISILTCHLCDFKCQCDQLLESHLRTHTGENTLECRQCKLTFNSDIDLKEHLLVHNKEKTDNSGGSALMCLDCNVQCSSDDELLDHIKQHSVVTQKEDNQFTCPECDFSCTLKAELDLHMQSHTGENPLESINQLFSDIVKAPVTRSNAKGANGLLTNQPDDSNVNISKKKGKKNSKKSKATTLSTEAQVQKKKATQFTVSDFLKSK